MVIDDSNYLRYNLLFKKKKTYYSQIDGFVARNREAGPLRPLAAKP